MQSQETIAVELKSIQKNISRGTVELQVWQKKERTLRGLKALGLCWGLALISVVLPIVHFVLVPAFFLAGPIAFFVIAGQQDVISGGQGECPECHKQIKIERSKVQWPLTDVCNHCYSQLEISKS